MAGAADQKKERREQLRRLVCTPAEIAPVGADQHSAIIHDLSRSGAFFLTRVLLEVGDRVKLTIFVSRRPQGKVVEVTGKIVRAEIFDLERADVWPYGVAVEFDEPLQGVDQELAELAEQLVRVGLVPHSDSEPS